MQTLSCPCHANKPYALCCRPLHRGEAACSAVALMRSRYSAYVLRKAAYLMATTLPGGRAAEPEPRRWGKEIEAFARVHRFLGLEIVEIREDGSEAWVTFIARLDRKDVDASFCETSHFCRHQGRWYYEGGEVRSLP